MTTTPRYKIAQWATGDTGRRALREVIRHPSMDLVGVFVYDEAKEGKDAGELCGEEPTGIIATRDRQAILDLGADCVIYMPRATGSGHTRAGLTQNQLLDDIVPLLASGTNIVTTCTDLLARGVRLGAEGQARVREACEKGKSSIWPSGSDPGFFTETFPFALLSVQRRIDLIELEEFGDLSHRPSPHMVMEQMRFGKPVEGWDPDRRKTHLYGEYQPALTVLADAAGLDVDEWTATGGVSAAREDTEIVSGLIEAGTAAAQKVVISGLSRGVEMIRFTQYAYVTRDLEPAWELGETGWRLRIHGDAPFDIAMPLPVPLDDLADHVPAYNANGPVNAIPYVCAARPGILTTEDLPPILPRGPRPAETA
ncbi:dihydrodipicolinate reductase [Streptomyces sp. NPDC090075]|uniref:NAD(P)H-dependent amine dehydrogenase family protein n=1 Tax=Streptomyces sp. NPDC090075 TaxID=3365937 RepID=UPI003816EB28